VSVNWQNTPPPPPPGTGDCSAYSDVLRVNIPWGSVTTVTTHDNGGIKAGTVFVGRITVPASATSPTDAAGTAEAVEFPDAPAERVTTLSTQPCDFRGFTPGAGTWPAPDPTGANRPLAWSGGNVPAVAFQLSGDTPTFPPVAQLVPGQTYYLNIRTIRASDGKNSCNAPSCNLKVVLRTPR
jgi:hypothetical protein